jgi:hypothetical protein
VYRLMCITTKIYDIRRLYGGITEPRARTALLRHAHRCNTSLDTTLVSARGSSACTTLTQLWLSQHGLLTSQVVLTDTQNALMRIQATYNNTSEIELEAGDVPETQPSDTLLYPIGTKVTKQFDGVDGELAWFEGVVQRYDEQDGLYWILYSDGDSEDVNEAEVREAVHDYKVYMQSQEVVAEVEVTAVGSTAQPSTVDTEVATVSVRANKARPAADVPAADTNSVQCSGMLGASEIAAAMRALTAAAEQLTTAAARIEAAVQTQRVQQPQPQQQQQHMLAVHPWQMHRHWQQAMLQRQQEQLRKVCWSPEKPLCSARLVKALYETHAAYRQ